MIGAGKRVAIWPLGMSGPAEGPVGNPTKGSHYPDMPHEELIVLVDDGGRPTGTAEKLASHHKDTPLHLGFSCYVFDADGLFLTTRRSKDKKVWPGVWTNSVCGHPAPGESFVGAIERRLDYELGMTAEEIEVVLSHHIYRTPPFRQIVEHEYCPVFVARASSPPRTNPAEVAEHRWVRWEDFVRDAQADTANRFSWWCKNQLRLIAGSLGACAAPLATR
jgi:isopentenyl-diphosphate delta-isomerase